MGLLSLDADQFGRRGACRPFALSALGSGGVAQPAIGLAPGRHRRINGNANSGFGPGQSSEIARCEHGRDPAPIAASPVTKVEIPTSAKGSSTAPAQAASDKHNETFSPDLKPAPNAYAQMSANGLVVWMTPRPGFSKPVPTSVIGYVRGLGMLVHDWEDNKHYFITDSGSWIADQR